MSHIEYSLDRSAALKILLHSAKYPAAAINGVLLGKVKPTKQQVKAADPGSPRTERVQLDIVDAVPLLHTFLTLAPALETALALVRQSALVQCTSNACCTAPCHAGQPKYSLRPEPLGPLWMFS